MTSETRHLVHPPPAVWWCCWVLWWCSDALMLRRRDRELRRAGAWNHDGDLENCTVGKYLGTVPAGTGVSQPPSLLCPRTSICTSHIRSRVPPSTCLPIDVDVDVMPLLCP